MLILDNDIVTTNSAATNNDNDYNNVNINTVHRK